jgi:PhnB protein
VTTRLNPYLAFGGTAREAMERYASIFGGTLDINTFGEYGDSGDADANGVMHAILQADDGLVLMASDMPPGSEAPAPGQNMSISLSGDDAEKLHGYWDKLAEGGTVAMPLERQVWGDEFGMCVDQFGVPWMVNITAPQDAPAS